MFFISTLCQPINRQKSHWKVRIRVSLARIKRPEHWFDIKRSCTSIYEKNLTVLSFFFLLISRRVIEKSSLSKLKQINYPLID